MHDPNRTEDYVVVFLPLQQLYNENMAFAIDHRKSCTDPLPEDDSPRQTRLRKQRYAEYVECHNMRMQRLVPKIDKFIHDLPVMLEKAKHEDGPDETFRLKCVIGCNCVEKSGWCSGHLFEFDHDFLSWTTENMTCPNSPNSPSSPSSPSSPTSPTFPK